MAYGAYTTNKMYHIRRCWLEKSRPAPKKPAIHRDRAHNIKTFFHWYLIRWDIMIVSLILNSGRGSPINSNPCLGISLFYRVSLSLRFAEHSSNSLDRQRTSQWSKTLFGKRRYNLPKSTYMYLCIYMCILEHCDTELYVRRLLCPTMKRAGRSKKCKYKRDT